MIETIDQLPIFFRMVASLIVVIALMGGLAMLIKRLGLTNLPAINKTDNPRLKVVERIPLDPRRQLILISRDQQEHLILLGHENETVIEGNIKPTAKTKASPSSRKEKASS